MNVIETLLLTALAMLLVKAVASDLKDGVVRNKMLTRFTLATAPLVGVYYVGPGRACFGDFLLNVGTCVAAAFALFCAKLLAGGCCKLLCCASFVFRQAVAFPIEERIVRFCWRRFSPLGSDICF